MLKNLNYPPTRRVDVSDDFFGTNVPDPYRWLEEADSPDVQAWTEEQVDFTEEIISVMPGRDTFRQRLKEVWNYPKYGIPRKRGTRLFFTKNDGLRAQPVLYVQDEGQEPRELIDPNTLSEDGTVSLLDWQPTKDGDLLMYGLSESGLDWRTFKFLNVDTGEHLDDIIERVKFSSISWLKDKSGFYYSTFPEDTADEGDGNQKVSQNLYFHKMGTPQSDDEVVYTHPELKGINIYAYLSDDNRFLMMSIGGERVGFNRLYYRDLASGDDTVVRIFDDLDANYSLVGNDGDILFVQTTKDAPHKRLIAVDINQPDEWIDIIPEANDVIQGITIANTDKFVVTYLRHAHHIVKVFDKSGHFINQIHLPTIGSTGFFAGAWSNKDDSEIFIPFTSYLQPLSILKYDFVTDTLDPFFDASVPSFNSDDYETKQVFYESKDGTTVPMFITAKKGLDLNGDNPTILYGYGGYNVSLSPGYASYLPVWLENGGVYAVANLRGGGEYGEAWHHAGMLDQKQNVYDDFISAAEWLIDNNYTHSNKLAIEGRSNGGLLVAACMVQRPDLYGAVLCHVPVIDMLRFQHFTAGRYWTSEYGDANKSKEHFDFLMEYSPLHNVKDGVKYPPLLIMTADHDDRVVPMHSKKFAAALQNADDGNNVILLRLDTKAGHGMGKPTAKLIEERVDIFGFLNALFDMGVK